MSLGAGCSVLRLVVESGNGLLNLGVGCKSGSQLLSLGTSHQVWEMHVKSGNLSSSQSGMPNLVVDSCVWILEVSC